MTKWIKKSDYLKKKDGNQIGFNFDFRKITLRDRVASSLNDWRFPPGDLTRAKTRLAPKYFESLVDHVTALIIKEKTPSKTLKTDPIISNEQENSKARQKKIGVEQLPK